MSETNTPRLLAAAKEFNIGKDTLVDFLSGKGFNKEDLKPNSKLTDEMYRSLQQEFSSDKAAKMKSNQIEIPKGNAGDVKKKKDEEEISFRKEGKKKPEEKEVSAIAATPVFKDEPTEPVTPIQAPIPKQDLPEITKIDAPELDGPKIISKIDLDAIDSSTRPRKSVKPEIQEEPIAVIHPTVDEIEKTPEPIAPKPIDHFAPVVKESKIEEVVPEIVAPIVETQPEVKIAEVLPPVFVEPITEPAIEKEIESASIETIQTTPSPIDVVIEPAIIEPVIIETTVSETPVIEPEIAAIVAPKLADVVVTLPEPISKEPLLDKLKIEAPELEGPKIVGRIVLPVEPDKNRGFDEKRKRKRIPIEKKGAQQPAQAPQQQQQEKPAPQQVALGGGGQFKVVLNKGGQQGAKGQGQGQQKTGAPSNNLTVRPAQPSRFKPEKKGERSENREIDSKEIQEKIRQTQAKLSGGTGKGKSLKAKHRRAKRDEMADSMGNESLDNKLQVTEFISVSELASLMDVSIAEIIGKCMNLGIMVSINQRLDAEVIELVVSEFGFEVEFIDMEKQMELEVDDLDDATGGELLPRSPIVTIMGHVDHGKTSLLDYIRNANVVAGEAGGITQHIGAYKVAVANGKEITFLDTPGHEAFTAMRARGAKVTDIAVIVVAADDAVMPQTREAISHAQAAGVPMIFAVNKIDKDGANPQKIYEQLAGMNILVEEWGGKFQNQEISAKQGLNVDLLLEKILLEAEVLDLKATPDKQATGTVVEATLDKGRGYVATVLVQNGTLKVGDIVVSGQHYGRVKAMFNERNKREDLSPPSTPVLILGLNGAPQAGEKFKVYEDESEAKEVASRRAQILREQGIRTKKHITLDEIGRRLALGNFKQLNIIIKGDVDGSVEALSDSLQKLTTEEIAVSVVLKGVGQITESDVLLATASDAIVIGFNVRPSLQANKLAETEGVQIRLYSIIYNAIEEIKSAMEGMLEPKFEEKIIANVEIREVYKFDKVTVAGCYVLDGKILRNSKIRVIRDGIVEYPKGEGQAAELGSLKRFKDDVKEVTSHMECGLTVKNYADIRVGDIIEAFEEEEVKRSL
jgi:translation initiation factor IF-2